MEDTKPKALFRKEAVDNKRQRLHGDILLLPRISHSLVITVLLVWLLFVAVWLSNSNFARKETVLGWLEPPAGVVRIYPQETGGMINSVLVEEGEIVVKGQPLVVVRSGRILADGGNLESKLLNEYESQRQLLLRQLERGGVIFSGRESELKSRIESASSESAVIGQQIETISQRQDLLDAQIRKASSLKSSGHISAFEYEGLIVQELTLREELQSLQRASITQASLINQYKSELELLPEQAGNEVDQANDRLSVLSQQISQLNGRQSYSIVAPRSGIVNNLQVIEGQQTEFDRSTPLMSILPEESSLAAQLLVPVRSAGFLEEEQTLNIRYDAFPYQKFGMHTGSIKSISKTLLLPGEVLNAPIPVDEPVYRIVATLQESTVNAYGKDFPLKPGMTLTADIKLGNRSLVEWLFEPLLSLEGKI